MVLPNTQGVRRKVAQIIGAQVGLHIRFETADANEQPPTALRNYVSGLNPLG